MSVLSVLERNRYIRMQKRDKYNKIEDFLGDASFRHWVFTKEDFHNWQEWTLENRTRGRLVEEASLFLAAMGVSELEVSQEALQAAYSTTKNKILLSELKNQKSKAIWNKVWFKAAAAVLILFSAYFYFQTKHYNSNSSEISYETLLEKNNEGLIEHTNNSSTIQVVSLSDGSSVLLQPKSKLSYPKKFGENNRQVVLSGEAFFEIKQNPQKPFLVYTNEVVTKVLGTSFRVIAYDDDSQIEILVKTGKVNVSQNKAITSKLGTPIDLLPDESIVFDRRNVVFEKIQMRNLNSPLAKDESEKIENLSFEFEDTPVSEIIKTIEKAYAVEIQYPEEMLKNCYLTTSLNDQPLNEKLSILCESLGNNTRFESNNNEIIIKTSGCN